MPRPLEDRFSEAPRPRVCLNQGPIAFIVLTKTTGLKGNVRYLALVQFGRRCCDH